MRKFIIDNSNIQEIIDFSEAKIFYNVGIHSTIIRLKKNKKSEVNKFKYIKNKLKQINNLALKTITKDSIIVNQNNLTALPWELLDEKLKVFFDKINSKSVRLDATYISARNSLYLFV